MNALTRRVRRLETLTAFSPEARRSQSLDTCRILLRRLIGVASDEVTVSRLVHSWEKNTSLPGLSALESLKRRLRKAEGIE